MLHFRVGNLHSASTSNPSMRYITIPTNLIRGINNHNPLLIVIRQHSRNVPSIPSHINHHNQKLYNNMQQQRYNKDLIIVVFPTPGGPSSSREPPSMIKSLSKFALPETARPTLQVSPTIVPFRFLIALIRCSVLLIPARLSVEKSPT